ncbi:MAG: CPBP family intramembrane metalloprotease [candidate division KSB1 bacterium]|nr:CPBP family intramembrane metalloprotease [candidate division KSB1 bacterium]
MVIIISSLALLLWQRIFKPDLQNFLSILPHLSTGWLLLGGTGFAVLNSIVEECIFRGILWDGLEQLFSNMVTILVLQASMFGIIHYRGFPNGLVGVGLAFIYGIFLGMIRHRSRGLLAPIITHIFADATIVSILGSLNF